MESRRKRSKNQIKKWCLYALLLLACIVAQTTPGLFTIGQAKPVYLLPLCLAVASVEDEFAGALFGAVCGLMWDYTAGRTVGLLALALLFLCFAMSVAVQLYLQCTVLNFVLVSTAATLLVLSLDFLFFYVMPGYAGATEHFVWVVLLSAALTVPINVPLVLAARHISQRYKLDNGIV